MNVHNSGLSHMSIKFGVPSLLHRNLNIEGSRQCTHKTVSQSNIYCIESIPARHACSCMHRRTQKDTHLLYIWCCVEGSRSCTHKMYRRVTCTVLSLSVQDIHNTLITLLRFTAPVATLVCSTNGMCDYINKSACYSLCNLWVHARQHEGISSGLYTLA